MTVMHPDLGELHLVMVPVEVKKAMKQPSLFDTAFLLKPGKQTRKAQLTVDVGLESRTPQRRAWRYYPKTEVSSFNPLYIWQLLKMRGITGEGYP